MVQILPMRALRPAGDAVDRVAAPPYDVVDAAEARALVEGRPDSFLRVSRPEAGASDELPGAVDPADGPALHALAARTLADLVARGVLVRDSAPALFVHRLDAELPGVGAVSQTGVACLASVADYESGAIAVHEHTRADKERDRVEHVDALDAHDEPVFLMHRPDPRVSALLAEGSTGPAEVDHRAPDGVRHRLWRVADQSRIAAFRAAFAAMPRVYVADGHHRSAAAARVAARRRALGRATPGSEHVLGVLFPADELTVLAYHRVVALPAGADLPALRATLGALLSLRPAPGPVTPTAEGEVGVVLDGVWYAGRLAEVPASADPVARLDVARLQTQVLAPVLAVEDPRTDPRITFVGGIHGAEGVAARAAGAVGFTLFPTSPFAVMDVADAGAVMPPKSTWFEPKLRSGLLVHPMDGQVPPATVSTGRLPRRTEVTRLVQEAYDRYREVTDGAVASYIPVLATADPDLFGIAVADTRGELVAVGDADHPFSVQSVSKAFVFALVCDAVGLDAARERLGVNATGQPFDSVVAVELSPDGATNPMVNAGAIAATSLVPGATAEEKWERIRHGLGEFAGRPLTLDAEVLASEAATNRRNRGVAHLLAGYGRMYGDPDEATDVYTRQCSLLVTARDLAVMGATLADGGVNPVTGRRVVREETARAVLAVLATAGLYERSGDWLFEVGLPGKSGVSGGIVTMAPGKGGMGTFSPPLDRAGNSVRGVLVTRHLSRALGLDLFASRPEVPPGDEGGAEDQAGPDQVGTDQASTER